MTLAAIVFTQIGAVFARRTDRVSIFRIGFFSNRLILLGIAVELALLCLLTYVPFFHSLFNTAPLNLSQWGFLILWSPSVLLVDEIRKAFIRKRVKQRLRNT
jgi:magnesium-transporting ATPase (P-type)